MSDETTITTNRASDQRSDGLEEATLGGGCFWCVEAVFDRLKGVVSVDPGYAGGHVPNPSYQQVCTDTTGHAEVARIVFDPKQLSYADLLRVFFATHDPTTLNRQGADVGRQYRSVIFPQSDEQRRTAEEIIREVTAEKLYDHPIVTTIEPYTVFYPAENYHKDYFANHPDAPYCAMVIAPKVAKFRQKFADRLK